MGVGLALALLLLAASEARAGKYAVAQCGWHVGADAAWADTTGGAKFRPDSYCATPAGADPFDGAHLKSFTRDGQQTVSGTRFARWRWEAPPGTGDHPGQRHLVARAPRRDRAAHRRRQPATAASTPSPAAATTDVTPRDFVAGFSPPQPALRGPPALRPGGEQVVQPRTGLVVGAAGADDHDRGRRRAGRGRSAATSPAGGWLRGAAGPAGLRAPTSAAASASARRTSTAPGWRSPSTPARRR